jgi:hypothetical protein
MVRINYYLLAVGKSNLNLLFTAACDALLFFISDGIVGIARLGSERR